MAAPIRASPPLLLTAIVLLATLLLASASFPSALAAYDDVPQGTRPYTVLLVAVPFINLRRC